MDILVFPQSSGGFWGGVTECGLGSARSSRDVVRRSAQSRESGVSVGGEPVNTVVDGQSAEAVLNGSAADSARSADSALVAAPADVLQAPNGTAESNGQHGTPVLDPPAQASACDAPAAAEVLGDAAITEVLDDHAAGTVPEQSPGDDTPAAPAADAVPDAAADGVTDSDWDSGLLGTPAGTVPEQAGVDFGENITETDMTGEGEPSDIVARPTIVTETLAAGALLPEVRPVPAVWDADRVVTEIYHREYKSLVRLAVLLVHDAPTAEEVVQDAFEAMHHAWRRLRDSDKALSYLRQAVVNRSRSVLRHRTVIDRNAPKPAPDEPSAEQGALALIERSAVVAALRTLPDRQREAIVLRYYADLSEADIAATMGISKGAVKSHTARAMAALKSILEQET